MLRHAADACVGRKPLQQRLWEGYTSDRGAAVTMLVGAPGSGKTTLARWLRWRVQEAGGKVAWFRSDPTAETQAALLEAIEGTPLDQLGRRATRDLLVIDGFERLQPQIDWLFDHVIGELGSNVLVVLLSRERLPLDERRKHNLGERWDELLVSSLAIDDARALLRGARLPARIADRVLAWADGHPLALRLAIDEWTGRDGAVTQLPNERLTLRLADALLGAAPSAFHELGLYAMAVAEVVDVALLGAMLGTGEGVHEVFRWLERLPNVDSTERGLIASPLVRQVLHRALAVRDPMRLQQLATRAVRALTPRLLGRHLQSAYPIFRAAQQTLRSEENESRAFLPSLWAEYALVQGQAAAELAATWIEKQQGKEARRQFLGALTQHATLLAVLTDRDGKPRAVLLPIADEGRGDRVAQEAWTALGASMSSERALLFRWLIDADSDAMPSPLGVHLLDLGMWIALAQRPSIDRVGFVVERGSSAIGRADWATVGAAIGLTPHPEFESEINGKKLMLLQAAIGTLSAPHADAGEPRVALAAAQILARAGLRWNAAELADGARNGRNGDANGATHTSRSAHNGAASNDTHSDAAPTIARDDFSLALRRALENMHAPPMLRQSPLCDVVDRVASPDVRRWPMADQRLSQWLAEGIARLALSEGTVKWAEVLSATYLRVQPKQQAVAVDLGIPYGTYRYQLRRALQVIEEELWQEINGTRVD